MVSTDSKETKFVSVVKHASFGNEKRNYFSVIILNYLDVFPRSVASLTTDLGSQSLNFMKDVTIWSGLSSYVNWARLRRNV